MSEFGVASGTHHLAAMARSLRSRLAVVDALVSQRPDPPSSPNVTSLLTSYGIAVMLILIALQAVANDARFRVGVDLDAYTYSMTAESEVARPFLFVQSEPPGAADPAQQQALRDAKAIGVRQPRDDLQLTVNRLRCGSRQRGTRPPAARGSRS